MSISREVIPWTLDIGATLLPSGSARFRVWAPKANRLSVIIVTGKETRIVLLQQEENGYFSGSADHVAEGSKYSYIINGETERADPASRFQPDDVHGLSQVVDPSRFAWEDASWRGCDLKDFIIYELHVGSFSGEGTFAGVIPKLQYLKELGITAIEIMPVAQFAGGRNWGYDGVYPFAPQNSYGGPDGFKLLINACHRQGLAVILDVVYNHLGPEGNYLNDFGFYFTDHYRTPWGDAVNFDGPYSDHVRSFFIANALYWVTEFHVDALRIDAVHRIFDFSARHFLEELAAEVHRVAQALGRKVYVIAESDLNDVRIIDPLHKGGYALDGQWSDDFHHALHTLLTGEKDGYYLDFGRIEHLIKAIREGFAYSGEYSQFRKRRHGNSAKARPAEQFVVFAQNHDQVGNRMLGERLAKLVSFESQKLAAGVVMLSPYIPLLFMGEEYGEDNPFLYFVSHSDPALVTAVSNGRKEEFKEFASGEPPEPESMDTFLKTKLAWEKRNTGKHKVLLSFYMHLIRLRSTSPALSSCGRGEVEVSGDEIGKLLWMRRRHRAQELMCLFNFAENDSELPFPAEDGKWSKLLDSAEVAWNGPGSLLPGNVDGPAVVRFRGRSCAVYIKEEGR